MEKQTRSQVVLFPAMKEEAEEIFFGEEEEAENDLSYWEFINSADSDADDVLSLSDASWHSSLSSPKDSPISDLIQESDARLLIQESHGHLQHHDYEPFHDGFGDLHDRDYEPYMDEQEDGHEEDDVDDYEDEVDDDGYDLDDELVPRSLSGKFVRERMRKLGKRAFAKMNTSKKSPIWYVKPGCVHGKHGLGLKHSC